MKRSIAKMSAALLGGAIALPIGLYAGGGARLIDVQRSPDGTERVEFYTPARWQTLSTSHRDMPAFVRLVRVRDTAMLGDSAVFDLSGEGQAIWSRGVVQIGSSAVYDRATAKWRIIQE